MIHHRNIFIFLFLFNGFECSDRPVISELFTSSKLVEGQKYFLTCVSNGKESRFEWLFNDRKVIIPNHNIVITNSEGHSMLNLKEMSLNESGDYTCKAINSFGEDSRTISVKLNGRWPSQGNQIKKDGELIFCLNPSEAEMDDRTFEYINQIKLDPNNEMRGDRYTQTID